jgi:drug/metabolite transporter (DMT)-like permease
MTTMNLVWDLTSDIIVTLFGVFYFKESIKGLRWLAVLFALFSLALFAYTHD